MQKIVFTTVETHALGESTHIITSGFPDTPGITMMEKKEVLEQRYDHLRRASMCEPRGHKDMAGTFILPAEHTASVFGVVFMDAKRQVNMCGHASIGCTVYAVEAGLMPMCEPHTEVAVDTPPETTCASVKMESKKAQEITLHNVSSFLFVDEVKVRVDDKEYRVTIFFGGTFFVLFDAVQLSLQLDTKDIELLIPSIKKLLTQLSKQYGMGHPSLAIIRIVNAEYYIATEEKRQKNIITAEGGQIDRSPCGAGTSAKPAYLHAKGNSSASGILVNESSTGTKFYGRYEVENVIGHYRGIQPMITGSAYTTGKAVYVTDENGPLTYGLTVWVYFCIMIYKKIQRAFELCWSPALLLILSFCFIRALTDEDVRRTCFLFMRETGLL